jgi:hypothetical protein
MDSTNVPCAGLFLCTVRIGSILGFCAARFLKNPHSLTTLKQKFAMGPTRGLQNKISSNDK